MISAVAMLFTACSDDKEAWEKLPDTPITGADAMLTFNGERSYGQVTLTPVSQTAGSIYLDNVIPGYLSVDMDVKMTEQPDGSFAIEGTKSLTTPPEMMPESRSDASFILYKLTAKGSVSPAGKAVIAIESKINESAAGNMTGLWHLPAMLPLTPEMMAESPVVVDIKLLGQPEKSAELSAEMSMLAGAMLYQTVGELDFNENGNLTLVYSPVLDFARLLTDGIDRTSGTFKELNPRNLSSGSNLVFWFYAKGAVHFSPYIPNIMYKIAVDNGQDPNLNDGATQEKLQAAIASLAEMGIDTEKMLTIFNGLNATGIPVPGKAADGKLTLLITKDMIDPFVELLAPALPALDARFTEFLADESNAGVAAILTEKIFPALGVKNLTELGMLWQKGVEDFTITINLRK